MGIYLELPVDNGKAEWLVENAGAEPFAGESFGQIPSGKLLVIVAQRPGFDVAAVIYDEKEWQLKTRLSREGRRPLRFLVVDRKKALELEPSGGLAAMLSGARERTSGVFSWLRRR